VGGEFWACRPKAALDRASAIEIRLKRPKFSSIFKAPQDFVFRVRSGYPARFYRQKTVLFCARDINLAIKLLNAKPLAIRSLKT
jgi:hypothetical protein